MTVKLKRQLRNPKRDLSKALDTLEAIAEEPIPQIFHVTLGKMNPVTLTKQCVSAVFSHRVREEYNLCHTHVQKRVSEAVETIKRYQRYVSEKLTFGDTEQQALARRTIEVVDRYNDVIGKMTKPPGTWKESVMRFLVTKSGLSLVKAEKIEISSLPSVHTAFSGKGEACGTSKKVATLVGKRGIYTDPTDLELDAFRMKAVSLLKEYGIGFHTVTEALHTVRQGLIHKEQCGDITNMTMTLSFPGEKIVIKGAFRHQVNVSHPIPVASSFCLSSQSKQTGFPQHPSLHNGWGLSEALIPTQVFHHDQLCYLPELLQKKDRVGEALLPHGKFIGRARTLLRKKREAFDKNRVEMVALHQRLALAIVKAASDTVISREVFDVVDNFFEKALHSESPYTVISDIYDEISDSFVAIPYSKLQNLWLELEHHELMSCDPQVSYSAALKVLQRANRDAETNTCDYVSLMGRVLGRASLPILLQHLTETIEFPPPMLTDFQQKVQASAYKQLIDFLTLIESDRPICDQRDLLKNSILEEIALFSADTIDTCEGIFARMPEEIENYYNGQFYIKPTFRT